MKVEAEKLAMRQVHFSCRVDGRAEAVLYDFALEVVNVEQLNSGTMLVCWLINIGNRPATDGAAQSALN